MITGTLPNGDNSPVKTYNSFSTVSDKINFIYSLTNEDGAFSDEIIEIFQLLGKEYPVMKDPNEQLLFFLTAAKVYWKSFEYEAAIKNGNLAKNLAFELRDKNKEADALRILGLIYSELGSFEKGHEYFFQSLAIYEKTNNEKGVIFSLNNIANAFADSKNSEKAFTYYEKALAISEEIKDSISMSNILHNLGVLKWEIGQYPESEFYVNKAIDINELIDDKTRVGINYMAVANTYSSQGRLSEAFEFYQKAWDIFEKNDSKIHLFRMCINFSEYYEKIKDYSRSLEYAFKGFEIGEELKLETMKIPAMQRIYQAFLNKGDTIKANEYGIRYYMSRDSLESNQDLTRLSQLEMLHNIENREQLLEIEYQKRKFRNYLYFFGFVVSIILIGSIIYSRYRLKKKKDELEKRNLTNEISIKNKELTLNAMTFMQRKTVADDVINELTRVYDKLDNVQSKQGIYQIIQELKKSNNKDVWKEFEVRFKDVHVAFYSSIAKQYPNLTPNEMKLAAFIRLNLSTKDIAELTGKRTETIEMARYRLRKKLGISNTDVNLVNLLLQI